MRGLKMLIFAMNYRNGTINDFFDVPKKLKKSKSF